jgi:hypothetical protein
LVLFDNPHRLQVLIVHMCSSIVEEIFCGFCRFCEVGSVLVLGWLNIKELLIGAEMLLLGVI